MTCISAGIELWTDQLDDATALYSISLHQSVSCAIKNISIRAGRTVDGPCCLIPAASYLRRSHRMLLTKAAGMSSAHCIEGAICKQLTGSSRAQHLIVCSSIGSPAEWSAGPMGESASPTDGSEPPLGVSAAPRECFALPTGLPKDPAASASSDAELPSGMLGSCREAARGAGGSWPGSCADAEASACT